MDQPLIRLEGVARTFYSGEVETVALDGVDLEIAAGEYVSIAGPSGCGKTTLLSLLGLLDSPSSGRHTFDGRIVSRLGASERARLRNREIGFVFQAFNLIGDLTAAENVALPLKYARVGLLERRHRVSEVLERVGMEEHGAQYPAELSGGQQQRVAVARAIVGRPRLLLADEPTGNLDSANGEAVMSLLAELHADGATVVMVTHDPRYARYAGREVHLFDGRVVRDDRGRAAEALERSGFEVRE